MGSALKWIGTTTAFLALTIALMLAQDKVPELSPAQDNPSFKFSVGTHLVLVPVVVNDKQGKHVPGLTAADFEIKEDGNVKKLANFEEITAENTVAERPVLPPKTFTNQVVAARPKKLEIILLDLLNTPLSGRAEARRGLIDFLSKSADPDTLTALLVLRSNSVRMIHNFTSDPSVLVAAIRKLQGQATSRDTPTMNTNGGDVDAEARQLGTIFAGFAALESTGIPTVAQQRAMIRGLEAQADASRQSQEGLITLECMEQISQYFAAVPGRKSLLWASTGFKFSQGSTAGATRGTTQADWQRAMRMLQEANIAVYPIDLAGVGLGGEGDVLAHGEISTGAGSAEIQALSAGGLADPTIAKHETMDTVAAMTGGRAFYNFNDSAELLRRARQDSSQYYMLSYYAAAGKDGWRKLNVQVHHQGAQVRARTGFFFHNAARDPDSARQTEETIAVSSDLESTSLPFIGQWQQIEHEGNKRRVHFALSIPPGTVVIDTEHENRLYVDFLVLAENAQGKEVGRMGQRLDRKLSLAEVDRILSRGITYLNSLTLEPGEYNVHIVVRDNLKGNLGSVATQLKVD